MIGAVGWRWTFRICGGYGMAIAIVTFLIMREPPRESAEEEAEEPRGLMTQATIDIDGIDLNRAGAKSLAAAGAEIGEIAPLDEQLKDNLMKKPT